MKITVENLLKWRDVAEKARDMNYALQEVENDDFILIDRSTGEIFLTKAATHSTRQKIF